MRASLGVRTSNGTSGQAALEIITSSNRGFILRQMDIALAAATASTFGLGRPAVTGITPTTPVSMLVDSGGDANEADTTVALAWGTSPTVPAKFYRRTSFPATIGSVISWVFNGGLYIPAGTTLVLWNLATNGVVDISITGDKQ